VTLEIYTILGEKVLMQTLGTGTGYITWDGRNQWTGRDVASGYYLYVITDRATGQRRTGKFSVIR
jgi:hypothetical protein